MGLERSPRRRSAWCRNEYFAIRTFAEEYTMKRSSTWIGSLRGSGPTEGNVSATGGYFGAMQLLADVRSQVFPLPGGVGGRRILGGRKRPVSSPLA